MIQRYGGVRTRSGIIQWYLDELNLLFEHIDLDSQILAYLGRLGQRPAFQRALKPSP